MFRKYLILACSLVFLTAILTAKPPNVSPESSKQLSKLLKLLDRLAEKEENPLLKRHFQSVAMISRDTTHGMTMEEDHLDMAANSLDFFKKEGKNWETYLSGARPLVMAFRSPTDGKNSYYWLFLPDGFEQSKDDFPFYMELHGSGGGSNNPPWKMLFHYLQAEEKAGTSQMIRREGFMIYPWGRGDKGYRDIAETDIWECLADFDNMFETDPQRQYLYGFSMGGAGTYRIARKSPERWAAIGMYSGGYRPDAGEVKELKQLPVWMAWGEEERFADGNRQLKEFLLKQGNELWWKEIEGVGHKYLGEYQEQLMDWLKEHQKH